MEGYRELGRGSTRWWIREGWEGRLPLPDRPDGWEALPGAEIRKRSGGKVSLSIPGGDGSLLVKVYRTPGGARFLRAIVTASPALREVSLFGELRGRGVPVTLPVAAGERRRSGLPGPSCLVVRPAPDARPLDALLLDGEATGGRRRRLLEAYGAFARIVHDRGVLQEDFDPNNAIRCESPGGEMEIQIVDMERVRLLSALGEAERARSLARLLRYGRTLPIAEQLRFLRAYAASDGDPSKGLRQRVEAVRRAWPDVVRRDRRRIRRGCLRPGRLFAPIRRGRIRGIHRVRFGEREEAILDASHLEPVISILEGTPLPTEPVPIEPPIRTRLGAVRARLVPHGAGPLPFVSRARRAWREANADLKEAVPAELPLALLEVGGSPLWRPGFVLIGRIDGYRPPPR